jgi:hypothetical protein
MRLRNVSRLLRNVIECILPMTDRNPHHGCTLFLAPKMTTASTTTLDRDQSSSASPHGKIEYGEYLGTIGRATFSNGLRLTAAICVGHVTVRCWNSQVFPRETEGYGDGSTLIRVSTCN